MLDFLLVARTERTDKPIQIEGHSLERNSIIRPDRSWTWSPDNCPQLAVHVWGHDVAPFKIADRVLQNEDGLTFLEGWAFSSLGNEPFRTAKMVRKEWNKKAEWAGEYLALNIDEYGTGSVERNLTSSVQIYSSFQNGFALLSTRPSIIASYVGKKRLSPEFVRWVGNYSVPLGDSSIFEDIDFVAPGSAINLHQGRLSISAPKGDMLFDPLLADRYRTNRRSYWDAVYSDLRSLVRIAEMSQAPIDFPISGGKDSRLLLGLLIAAGLKERIVSTYTRGPEFSPEVISGKAVAEHLGLQHRNVWSGTPKRQDIPDLPNKILRHLFVTEGEMSPVDLSTGTRVTNEFQLTGQEAGLRNISGRRDVSTRTLVQQWMKVHFGDGDFCGIHRPEAAEACRLDLANYIDRAEREGTPYDQIPTRHRVEHRGARWVSRVWGAMNALGWAPQVFRSEVVTRATYSAGAKSRQLEEFHYEMLLRVDPALVHIPFAGQVWDAALAGITSVTPPEVAPLSWPENFSIFSQRGMYGAMQDNFEQMKSFIVAKADDALSSVIDLDKLSSFKASDIQRGHVQPLWQVFQCAIFNATEDFGGLREDSFETIGAPALSENQQQVT